MRHDYHDEITPRLSIELRLFAVAVIVAMPLVCGVYWVCQLPPGPAVRAPDPVVLVELVRRATVAPPSEPVARPLPPAEERRREPVPEPPAALGEFAPLVPPVQMRLSARDVDRAPGAPSESARSLSSSVASAFQRTLLSHFERYRRYPAQARRQRLQGRVQVHFTMLRDGSVVEVKLKTSSGEPLLDDEAIATVRRAEPLPPIPVALPDRLNILIPVDFRLP